ncbi:hypothetical protein KY325_01525 [Candidatus Woesearchaeota archaeon]|nr:hypothetical protein [Candidatus Woesearchaeota archaeon]
MSDESSVAEKPKIVSVRGGLSPEGIVRLCPEGLDKKPLEDVVQYAIRTDQLKDDTERAIADSIKREMKKTGQYILVLNGIETVEAEKIKEEILEKYFKEEIRDMEGGQQRSYHFAEIAVASVQEGGLEYKL